MVTIPEIIEQIIKSSPFLEEGLSLGIINTSALARQIQPEVQKRLYSRTLLERNKKIKTGAIVMALNRLSQRLNTKSSPVTPILKKITDITVRSNLTEFTFENSSTLLDKQGLLLQSIKDKSNIFLAMTDGVFETTFFASAVLESDIERIFSGETLRNKLVNLSSITLILPKEAVDVPGVYYSILKMLAWDGINFVEVVSSYTELTIFLQESDVDLAFSILKKLNSSN